MMLSMVMTTLQKIKRMLVLVYNVSHPTAVKVRIYIIRFT
jgi:hypothetical protein